ncbi:beta-glucuronidase [Lindgomyces ingoldianus]|uniref:Beta-glucuronidase n=1 Tax=Lindgomyces ingoldianus TaxID=673940 RepID=A0ACB6R805_9PLEO|nr:beta-glucuronidase [Lindgomyces ingoldianus]KAF2474657.1 beta-glucuronidase [Lindgomyces ingoldianus]
MASLQALLLATALLNIASSAPAEQFADATTASRTGSALTRPTDFNPVPIAASPSGAGEPVLNSFVSFSIELAFFPDFAGDKENPNTFSDNLLNNLGSFQGSKPNIRVGGNTQDYALYDANLKAATNGTIIPSISKDYPRILSIGPKFFESYQTWPGVKFIHGFNLAKNDTAANASATDEAAIACKFLELHDNFLYWEMGNEPDLFKTSAQGVMRPASWNEQQYTQQWNIRVQLVKDSLSKNCGADWVTAQNFKWLAPSFAGTSNSLDAVKTWKAGLDQRNEIELFSSHNYIGGATQPGVTLAGFLMNHTKTVSSVSNHNKEQAALKAAGMNMPYILGEANSLYNQGAPALSNSFGAALWGVDFNLMCAATDIRQVYMHMGTNFRYASWQPVATNTTSIGTKAPYYGNIAVAASLGDITQGDVRVQNIPLKNYNEAAYTIYEGEKLKRLVVINMHQYNYSVPVPLPRGETTYNFTLPTSCSGHGLVQRLIANGSDAITGITFNGASYNYELDHGKPKLLGNVTKDETVWVGQDGGIAVGVPWSSAALVQLEC